MFVFLLPINRIFSVYIIYSQFLLISDRDWYCTVKTVFNELCNLNDQDFQTWISRAYDLATMYQIDMNSCTDLSSSQFKKFCYERLKNSFMNSWVNDLRNGHDSFILRT